MLGINHRSRGFALPTILIASVIMLTVLISTVSATSSIRSALDSQYFNQLAREAAESGLERANACLTENSYTPQWSTASPLHPNTTCTGGAGCTNADSCFVMRSGNVRTTFTVGTPTNQNLSQVVVATGTVELTRKTTGDVWRTYSYSASGRVGVDLNLNTVAFGYVGPGGGSAYFATIAADGAIKAAGYNAQGQLGNGTTASTLIPTAFQLPATIKATSIYTNFLSLGYNMFVITTAGDVYGAGQNTLGQLGDSTFTDRSVPVKFGLPAGKIAKSVSVGGYVTFVITTDNNIYAVGDCSHGLLGSTYTIAGCTNKSSYVRVALPTPTADTNTQPTSEMPLDRLNGFVRMVGGRVYGWGINDFGQLATGGYVETSTPTQIGTYGNTGQPKAVSTAFDGDSFFVVDDGGTAMASGRNTFGELGGEGIPINLTFANKCLDNKWSDGVTMQFWDCNTTGAQRYTFRSDGSIYNPATGKCLDNQAGNGVTIQLYTCNGTGPQRFVLRDDKTIYNAASNKCLDNAGSDTVTIQLYTCNNSQAQFYSLTPSPFQVRFSLPTGAGNAVRVVTDEAFTSVLTDSGQVWSAGNNAKGQLGNGATAVYQPYPVKFILPAGVTAVDVWSSAFGTTTPTPKYLNTFVVGSDGKVYGAGSNSAGQLGDGTTTDRSTPVAMNVIDGVNIKAQKVLSGNGTTIILTTNKKIYTVGNNDYGQLGDGTTTNSSIPKANRFTNVLPLTQF